MRPRTLTALVVSVIAALGFVSRASAFEPQGPMVEFTADGGWRYHPATQNGTVVGFLAEQVAGNVAPNGFTVAWYERSGDAFTIATGWKDATVIEAGVKVATDRGQLDLFSNATIGADIWEAIRSCEVANKVGSAVQAGLALDDPYQPIAAMLPPEVMEFVVEIGAAGATALSAKEVDLVPSENGPVTAASKELLGLESRIEAEIAGGNGLALAFSWPCWPGTYCRSTSVTGPCNLVGGFGNGSCSGCKYTCTVTTFTTCAYISLNCTVGPATTTTTTTTKNKSCAGDPTNCPPTPPPGC